MNCILINLFQRKVLKTRIPTKWLLSISFRYLYSLNDNESYSLQLVLYSGMLKPKVQKWNYADYWMQRSFKFRWRLDHFVMNNFFINRSRLVRNSGKKMSGNGTQVTCPNTKPVWNLDAYWYGLVIPKVAFKSLQEINPRCQFLKFCRSAKIFLPNSLEKAHPTANREKSNFWKSYLCDFHLAIVKLNLRN